MFRNIQNNKIGNLLIYLANKIQGLGLTKALKLLYIIDETSVKEAGFPVTWLDYKVWELGPVAPEIHQEIHNLKKSSLSAYIDVERQETFDNDTFIIKARTTFDDGEFSDYEIDLIDNVINQYGNLSAKVLIEILHSEDSLWYKNLKKYQPELVFSLYNKRSNIPIELADLIVDDDFKLLAYKASFDALDFQTQLQLTND